MSQKMATGVLIKMPGVASVSSDTPKSMKRTMDTVLLTPSGVEAWKAPPFQRPLRVNAKLIAIAEELKHNGGVIEGVLTIGILDRMRYLIDGQHRVEAFKRSGLAEGYADVRICHFDNLSEMANEFLRLNTSIVKLRPDDMLRSLENSIAGLQTIRKRCPFIGYDMIRRAARSPVLSMSLALRAWYAAMPDVPTSSTGSAVELAQRLDAESSGQISHFYECCCVAFGRDPEYFRVWGTLNLTIAAWMWRRTVLSQYSPASVRFTPQQFTSGLRALTASSDYMDWLIGRQLTDRDRSPCYDRMKTLVVRKLQPEFSKKIKMPSPSWASSGGHIKRTV